MFGIEKKITAAARKAALFTGSAFLASVGVAFLTVSAWLVLAELKSTIFAATVIGVVYIGFALIGLALANVSPKDDIKLNSQAQNLNGLSPLQLIAVSFLQGIEQGARSRRQTKPPQ